MAIHPTVSPPMTAPNEMMVDSGNPVLFMSRLVTVLHSMLRMYSLPNHECIRLYRGGRRRVTKHAMPARKMR